MTMQDEFLYGFEIKQALSGVGDIISADLLHTLKPPTLSVCNTSTSDSPGTHWVVICIDKHRNGEFFDSFGMHPAVYGLENGMSNADEWFFNDYRLQHPSSVVCGYYTIAYCMAKIKGVSMVDFLSIFTSNAMYNDKVIYNLYN